MRHGRGARGKGGHAASLFVDSRVAVADAVRARAPESQWRTSIFIALALAGTALITAFMALALVLMR